MWIIIKSMTELPVEFMLIVFLYLSGLSIGAEQMILS